MTVAHRSKGLHTDDAEIVRIVLECAGAIEARRALADSLRLLDQAVRRRRSPRAPDRAAERRSPHRVDA